MRALLLIFFMLSFIPQAFATSKAPAPSVTGDFSAMKHTATLRADKVIDAQTVLMTDGKIVRLSGLDYPFVAGGGGSEAMVAAKAVLESLLPKGTELLLYQSRNAKTGRTNRMGHTLAHLVTKKGGLWINGLLLAEGLAWTSTDYANPDMAAQMYAIEDKARSQGRILWARDSVYGLLSPETASTGNGTFRIVQGTVNRAATARNNLYLNFGTDWKKDFTVMMSPALRKALSRKGIDPMALSGREVRVRGWLRDWNGPYMELETIERLEILSTPPSTPLSPEPSPPVPQLAPPLTTN